MCCCFAQSNWKAHTTYRYQFHSKCNESITSAVKESAQLISTRLLIHCLTLLIVLSHSLCSNSDTHAHTYTMANTKQSELRKGARSRQPVFWFCCCRQWSARARKKANNKQENKRSNKKKI